MNKTYIKLKRRKGIVAANFSLLSIGLFMLVGTVLAVVFFNSTAATLTGSKLQTATDEVATLDTMMKEYSVNGTAHGSGYKAASAKSAVPYSTIGLKLDSAGTSIQSKTSYGSKIKYQVAPNGTSGESYNILVDARGAWDGWDSEQKVKYVTGIARNFQKLNMRPADEIGNVINMSGSDASSATTLVADNTPVSLSDIAGDDGRFTIFYLGK